MTHCVFLFEYCVADSELVHKLDEELSYEKENEETTQPAFIKEFLEANSFKVIGTGMGLVERLLTILCSPIKARR